MPVKGPAQPRAEPDTWPGSRCASPLARPYRPPSRLGPRPRPNRLPCPRQPRGSVSSIPPTFR